MPTREERFYEAARREIAEGKVAQATWSRAASIAVCDEEKARALYIELRVAELERYYQQSVADLLRESQAEIASGRQFVCPYCEVRTTAKREEVDFLVQVFKELPRILYTCRSCGHELRFDGLPPKPLRQQHVLHPVAGHELRFDGLPPKPKPAAAPGAAKKNNAMSVTGFALGLVSVLFYAIGIIPILAVVFSGLGLAYLKPEAQKNRWMGVVGLALGIIYTIMMLDHYGHMK